MYNLYVKDQMNEYGFYKLSLISKNLLSTKQDVFESERAAIMFLKLKLKENIIYNNDLFKIIKCT